LFKEIYQFSADGAVIIWTDSPRNGLYAKQGIYLIEGNMMRFILNGIALNHEIIINKIDGKSLIISTRTKEETEPQDWQIQEFMKIREDF
jgi:hypothetical protein